MELIFLGVAVFWGGILYEYYFLIEDGIYFCSHVLYKKEIVKYRD